ncbi:hypothetical protein SAMN03159463_00913 [Mesorhizobium sp. NFR06]|uniref:hypothetical protein n=1 Tax=Mesorhizobium sp. NFR06 TaxID=1566290 RepID=UPI0008DEEB77|nr:hypothetical protein [Mesorhizobium sp. NFR06]SFO03581.1 hypothetical protein SAMN03159463_00913 [Mesorhizobium sp. NFR06]
MYLDMAILILTSIVGFILIIIILRDIIVESRVPVDPSSPSSFFSVRQISSKSRVFLISFAYSIPFALIYLYVSLYADSVVSPAKDFLISKLDAVLGQDPSGNFQSALKNLPASLSPIFVLLVSLLIFAPILRAPFVVLAQLLLRAAGTRQRVDVITIRAGTDILSDLGGFDNSERALDSEFRDTPLPIELAESSDVEKFSYKLLYLSSTEFPQLNLVNSLKGIAKRIGVKELMPDVDPDEIYKIMNFYLVASVIIYSVLCCLYIFFIPEFNFRYIESIDPNLFQPFNWPAIDEMSALASSVAQRSLSFVFLIGVGYYMFSSRRRYYSKVESEIQSAGVVFAFLTIFSFVINLAFVLVTISRSQDGELGRTLIAINQKKIWIEIFLPSLTAGLALIVAAVSSKIPNSLSLILVVCFSSVWFFLSQYIYEINATQVIGYYWHQAVLGFCLSSAYFFSVYFINDTRFYRLKVSPSPALVERRPKPESGSAAATVPISR